MNRLKPKASTIEMRKACRCRGQSSGRYKSETMEHVPVGVGMLLGLPLELRCDKCGKAWKEVKPARRTRKGQKR